jgi:hypothetical protein
MKVGNEKALELYISKIGLNILNSERMIGMCHKLLCLPDQSESFTDFPILFEGSVNWKIKDFGAGLCNLN